MSFHIFGISVPSDSQRYCSSISHHFIQFHAAEWDNADIQYFFLCSVHEFAGSQGFHRENSCVMDPNRGRHCTVLTYWKCKISCIHSCRWLPQLHLAAHVTSHLIAAVILSVQQQGPIALLVFLCTSMQIFCFSCLPLTTWGGLCSIYTDPYFYECRD